MVKKQDDGWFDHLVQSGRQRGGSVSLDEVNRSLPKGHVSADQIDDVMGRLSELGVAVVDSDTLARKARREELASKTGALFDRKKRRDDEGRHTS